MAEGSKNVISQISLLSLDKQMLPIIINPWNIYKIQSRHIYPLKVNVHVFFLRKQILRCLGMFKRNVSVRHKWSLGGLFLDGRDLSVEELGSQTLKKRKRKS